MFKIGWTIFLQKPRHDMTSSEQNFCTTQFHTEYQEIELSSVFGSNIYIEKPQIFNRKFQFSKPSLSGSYKLQNNYNVYKSVYNKCNFILLELCIVHKTIICFKYYQHVYVVVYDMSTVTSRKL